jgi:uncharacterized membrane protein
VLLSISRFLQIFTMGLSTGLLFGDRVGVTRIRPQLPAAAFVLYQQQVHLRFVWVMPILLGTSLVAGVISLVLLRRNYQSRAFIFTLIATLCTVGVVILTRLINVPVNETLMTWQASSPPENVMQLWAPWEGSHTIRTIIAVLGFASLAYSTTSSREPTDATNHKRS